jgi:hypothetical protein
MLDKKYIMAETQVVEQKCCGRTPFSMLEFEIQTVLDHMCIDLRLVQNSTCIGPSVPELYCKRESLCLMFIDSCIVI